MKIFKKLSFKKWFKYNNIIFSPLAFILLISYLFSPEKVANATQTLIIANIFFYIVFSLFSYFLFEGYNTIYNLLRKPTKIEKEDIINKIKEDNPTLSKTAIISLEHLIDDNQQITMKQLNKKLNEINNYVKS